MSRTVSSTRCLSTELLLQASGLKLERLSKIYFDDAIVARFRWYFYLKYIAVGYAFELTKLPE